MAIIAPSTLFPCDNRHRGSPIQDYQKSPKISHDHVAINSISSKNATVIAIMCPNLEIPNTLVGTYNCQLRFDVSGRKGFAFNFRVFTLGKYIGRLPSF